MILCYEHIKEAFSGLGQWQAFRDGERIYSRDLHLNPNSIDVTLGDLLLIPSVKDRIDPEDADSVVWINNRIQGGQPLDPGDFVLAHVRERFDCSAPLMVNGKARRFIPMIEGRSTLARCGLSAHECAGFGDLGFSANFTLELSTHLPIVLRPGFRIAQVFFIEASSGSKKYSSVYSDQIDEPRAPVLGVGRV